MALDSKQVISLKKAIDEHLKKGDVYSSIRHHIKQYCIDAAAAGETKGNILDSLKEKGIIERIISSMEYGPNLAAGSKIRNIASDSRLNSLVAGGDPASLWKSAATTAVEPGRRYLHMRILGGRAFVGHIIDESAGHAPAYLVIQVHFRKQIFRSKPVSYSVEPAFDESFMIDLQPENSKTIIDVATLLSLEFPIHVCVLKYSLNEKELSEATRAADKEDSTEIIQSRLELSSITSELCASQLVEWRRCLGRGGISLPVELPGVGQEAKLKVPIGVLDVRFDILPEMSVGAVIPQAEITRQLRYEVTLEADSQRQFYQYAKAWWEEFLQVDPTFKTRLVKIFAENEWGEHRSVCAFVTPFKVGRLLESSYHAARYVSLLPFTRLETVGGGRDETWHSLHTITALGKGDCEDHAVLLASLLLGFGLDAFVVIGSVDDDSGGERDHVWVMTRSGRRDHKAMFWESLTGQRYTHDPATPERRQHPYKRVGCVFNHRSLFANKQPTDAVETCLFELEHEGLWKSMEPKVIEALTHVNAVPLIQSMIHAETTADSIETSLREIISNKRRLMSLSTVWDDDLSYILTPALAAYEMERLFGTTFGDEEFQQSIKNSVPEGHSFKGFPILFNHVSAARMLDTFEITKVAQDILQTTGDRVNFALRVKIFPYAEHAVAVWLMLAVRFRPIGT